MGPDIAYWVLLDADGVGEIVLLVVLGLVVLIAKLIQAAVSKAKGGAPPRPAQPPGEAGGPGDEIRSFLSALGVETPKPPQQQRPPQQPRQPQAQERTVYQAGDDQVKSYLQSIGVAVEERPQRPAPQPRPAQRQAPRPAPPRPVEAIIVEAIPVAEEAPPARVVSRKPSRPAPQPKPVASEPARIVELGPAEAPTARTRLLGRRPPLGSLGPLGNAPTVAELRRAVILAEIIQRPDFSRFPYERLKI